jgi:hypothetical protein
VKRKEKRNEWYEEECRKAQREKNEDFICYTGQHDKHMINTRKVGKRLIK